MSQVCSRLFAAPPVHVGAVIFSGFWAGGFNPGAEAQRRRRKGPQHSMETILRGLTNYSRGFLGGFQGLGLGDILPPGTPLLRHGPHLCIAGFGIPHANVRGLGPGMPAPSPRATGYLTNPVIGRSARASPTRPRRNRASSMVRVVCVLSVLWDGYKVITCGDSSPQQRYIS